MDQLHPELAEEEIAHEARRGPLLLSRGFGDFPCLGGADFPFRRGDRGRHRGLLLVTYTPSSRLHRSVPMRSALQLALPLALSISLAAQAPPRATSPAPALILVKAGRLIDGRADAPQSNVAILIEGEAIKAAGPLPQVQGQRSEEHTSELQSRLHLVCRLLLEKKKKKKQ